MEDHDRIAPLYAQVKQRLQARIDDGTLVEGQFLAPEPALCDEMGVSRITLRRAVKELCAEGLLIRQQGRGTVVARKKVQQTLVSLSGFSDAFEGEKQVSHAILNVDDRAADPEARAILGARQVTLVERLIFVDDRPFTLEALFIDPASLGHVIGPVRDGASFFQTLRQQCGPDPASADRIINVGFATAAQRKHLQIGPTQPVYRIDKTVRGSDGEAIAFSRLLTPTHLITYSLRT